MKRFLTPQRLIEIAIVLVTLAGIVLIVWLR
jgi:hypothetical protein